MSRHWLPGQPRDRIGEVFPVLYDPKSEEETCSTCAEKGYMCVSLAPTSAKCSACELGGLEYTVHESEDDDDGVVLLRSVLSSEGASSTGAPMLARVNLLRRNVNKKLKKLFSTSAKQGSFGKGPFYVAWEPSRLVFEEFCRLRKEGWARFGWHEGRVYYFGDPSSVHQTVIDGIVTLFRQGLIVLLEHLPPGPLALEEVWEPLISKGLSRGEAAYDALFFDARSTAVHDLSPKYYVKHHRQPVRRARKPSKKKMVIKEGDFLIAFNEAIDDGTFAIAGEVAYGNETIKEAKMESLLWKSKARISFVIKIDAEIKHPVDAKGQKITSQKTFRRSRKVEHDQPQPAAVAVRQASVDPQIALFLVTDRSLNAGIQRAQYNIGRGSGVSIGLLDAQIRRASKDDPRMFSLIKTLDWSGESAQTTKAYTTAMSGFNLVPSTPSIRLPVHEILKDALGALMSGSGNNETSSQRQEGRAARQLFNEFVRSACITIDTEAIRGLVVKSCIREATSNLVKYDSRTGDEIEGGDAVSMHDEERSAVGGDYDWDE